MLASVLMDAGYSVGLYTSPHLKSFRERIRVNGQMVPEQFVVDFTALHQGIFEELKPSFFEMTVAMAFEYFAQQKVDVAVIEVGLGGRLDSTNIISPEISIITNIGLDHTDLLGNTIELIAAEKAGIIKPDTPIVIGETQPQLIALFEERAKKLNAPILFADKMYSVSIKESNEQGKQAFKVERNGSILFENLSIDLLGNYQIKNLPGVLTAIPLLVEKGFCIKKKNITNGLANIVTKTGLIGRWQLLGRNPLIICDTGHNVDGIRCIVEQISKTPHNKTHFVLGMVGDKDIDGILELLPKSARYYFANASIPRALSVNELATKSKSHGLIGQSYQSVSEAIKNAKTNAQPNDLIFIGGSTFTVADALILQ